ncbi:Acetyl-coenzyme A synthetase [Cognatishimia activa]|uniref:Acetyl-coenzyme A synthetase n=1 Tax=Cognatishimia activa TaxID=1715691 RepID=A0A0N7MBA3_9RHOB|nr:AMP-binding protein [Cognatishimia activa]CUK24848.1 Acetyl-coenzyme A synthetase [Cognatishimia activa]
MLERKSTVSEMASAFRWQIPDLYNLGVDISDRPAERWPDRVAIVDVAETGDTRKITFSDLKCDSNRLAQGLQAVSKVGDRIAVFLPQSIETALCHIAICKSGCISLPLFCLFGPDALLHRLKDAGARVIVTDRQGLKKINQIRAELPALERVYCVDGEAPDALDFADLLVGSGADFKPAQTKADDPALLIYTSGTTGNPKGALHAHRVLLGHLPGVEMSHNFFPQPKDVIWTPADWAWIGGLLDVLMPALHHGVTVIACRFKKFTAKAAFDLMENHHVTSTFLPPTALKMMRADESIQKRTLSLRSVASGGEPLGAPLLEWGRKALGADINEFYGQTECNMIVSSCSELAPSEPGIMGFPVPGHVVDVLDEQTGVSLPIGAPGDIAVRAPDPVMFLRYWNNPEATQQKYRTVDGVQWLLTGDKGTKTESGRIAFLGRDDDVINSSGYRIGPAEIEDCLITHPSVVLAGVVAKPDPIRGSIVAAYVQLAAGVTRDESLAEEIKLHVKSRLAAYEAPRIIRFVDAMPTTTTGKIIRAELRKLAEAEAHAER